MNSSASSQRIDTIELPDENGNAVNSLSYPFGDNINGELPLFKSVSIVIPYYNESSLFFEFISSLTKSLEIVNRKIKSEMRWNIVCIDDGSVEPLEGLFLKNYKENCGNNISIYLLKHIINLGQGAALNTGINFAHRTLGSDIFITMDADGQHDPLEIPNLLVPLISQKSDIVFGNRFASKISENMPKGRQTLLKLASIFEKFITKLDLTDAHNGFRAFNSKTASVFQLTQNRMAHATEIKQIVHKQRLRYTEVPVTIKYSDETNIGGQSNAGSFFILKDLLKTYLFNN